MPTWQWTAFILYDICFCYTCHVPAEQHSNEMYSQQLVEGYSYDESWRKGGSCHQNQGIAHMLANSSVVQK